MAIAVCSVAILVVSIKTYTFDKNLNQVVLKEKSLVNKQELTVPLNQISAFRVEKADKLYEIVLVFKTGACWRLVTGYARERPVNKIIEKIENFLSSQEAWAVSASDPRLFKEVGDLTFTRRQLPGA